MYPYVMFIYIIEGCHMYIILRRNWGKTGISGSSREYSLISREVGETQ